MYKYIFMILLFLLFLYVKYNTNLIEGQKKDDKDKDGDDEDGDDEDGDDEDGDDEDGDDKDKDGDDKDKDGEDKDGDDEEDGDDKDKDGEDKDGEDKDGEDKDKDGDGGESYGGDGGYGGGENYGGGESYGGDGGYGGKGDTGEDTDNEEDNWGEDKEKKDTSNMNNTKYIPSAGTNYMLNNYVMSNHKITFPHIISKTKYETTCNKPQVFKYTNVEYKKNFYDKKSNKIDTLNWYFRPIITGQKNMHDMYKLETDIDKYSMNDPLNDVYMNPKSIKNEIATFPSVKQPIKNTLFKDGK